MPVTVFFFIAAWLKAGHFFKIKGLLPVFHGVWDFPARR